MNINLATKKFIDNHELVLIGYEDTARGVNLVSLLECWIDSQEQDFALVYPFAADHVEILTVKKAPLKPNIFRNDIVRFAQFPHSKGWMAGHEIDLDCIKQQIETFFTGKVKDRGV